MEDCKTVKSTENSLVVDYEGFTPEFFKAAQKALKWGATKTDFDDWYESKTNYSTETLDTIYVKDADGKDALLWPRAYDGKVRFGCNCPANAEEYKMIDAKCITPEYFKTCTYEDFQKIFNEVELPALIQSKKLDLSLRPSRSMYEGTDPDVVAHFANTPREVLNAVADACIWNLNEKVYVDAKFRKLEANKEYPLGTMDF